VAELQHLLGIEQSGQFDTATEAAVEAFQQAAGLEVDGIAGPKTMAALHSASASTDDRERVYTPVPGLSVKRYFLPAGEYKPGPTAKQYLFLHHTAGWHKPCAVVEGWARDQRGPIATEIVLGGRSVRGDDGRYDGELVQSMPAGGYGWHLGRNGSQHMHTHSVANELCNFSYLEQGRTYVGTPVAADQIVTLDSPFRGHRHWHAYSPAQLETLRRCILWIAERDSIDVRAGLVAAIRQHGARAFEYNEDAYYGRVRGMWTHANIRRDKFDLFPQSELIDMLLTL
jgi:hypothetical protein